MSDIFLSYAREDREAAHRFAAAFESEGYSVWWDRHIPTGRVFDEVIEEAIEKAACVVVLWSSHSTDSKWVKTEAGEGANRDILLPVQIERVKPPLRFRQYQTAEMTGWKGEVDSPAYIKLMADISRIARRPLQGEADSAQLPDEKASRYTTDTGDVVTGIGNVQSSDDAINNTSIKKLKPKWIGVIGLLGVVFTAFLILQNRDPVSVIVTDPVEPGPTEPGPIVIDPGPVVVVPRPVVVGDTPPDLRSEREKELVPISPAEFDALLERNRTLNEQGALPGYDLTVPADYNAR